jgi:hypothetical protein
MTVPGWALRLVCATIGHRTIKTITGLKPLEWSMVTGLHAEITNWRVDCHRCGRKGLTARDRRDSRSVW